MSICESLLELSPLTLPPVGLVPGASPGNGGRSYLSSLGLGEASLAPGFCWTSPGKGGRSYWSSLGLGVGWLAAGFGVGVGVGVGELRGVIWG